MARTKRHNKGVALVTILVIGLTSIIFMLAIASIVTQSVRSTSANKWSEELRNAAEIGIDYAINQYNSTYPCLLEPEPGKADRISFVPPQELTSVPINGVTPGTGIPNLTVSIKVMKLTTADQWKWVEQNSSIYSRQRDPNKSVTESWQVPASSNMSANAGGGYRVIECTASNDLISRTIRVVLEAQFVPPLSGEGPDGAIKSQPSYFDKPMFSNSKLTLAALTDGGTLNVYDASAKFANNGLDYNLNVVTNQDADIQAGTNIFGNLQVSSSGTSQDVALIGDNSSVYGTVRTNGGFGPVATTPIPSAPSYSSDNVFADAELRNPDGSLRAGARSQSPAQNEAGLSQNLMAPVQQPSSAQPLESLAANAGQTLSGDYQSGAIIADNNLVEDSFPTSPVSIANTPGSEPVRLFVQDTTGSNDAVNIKSAAFNPPTDPRSLQLWYEGTKPVNIQVSSNGFSGLIYAPNAQVTISGAGNFTGGIVGQSVKVTLDGDLRIRTDLSNVLKDDPTGDENRDQYKLSYQRDEDRSSLFRGWKPITWHEFKPTK